LDATGRSVQMQDACTGPVQSMQYSAASRCAATDAVQCSAVQWQQAQVCVRVQVQCMQGCDSHTPKPLTG
jgi:hypothetical protein